MTNLVTEDVKTIARSVLDIKALMAVYFQAGPGDADKTLELIAELLEKREVAAAARRVIAGYGLRVVK